jgi:DNA-binding response OmpR family regulator
MNSLDPVIAPESRNSDRDDKNLQILIVEDEQHVREALVAFARHEGYRAEAVSDGLSGLAVVEVKRPQVVILDLRMPIMDGFEFMERLADQMGCWRPKILLLTAVDRLDLVQIRAGADAYIQKPFDPERLRAALRRLVRPERRLAI